ncbi:MAG: B12-binding domain-containing radical SAM protein [Candidatus Hodarchaeales archaeon]|jgi:anaerobic magnesium-protoporphyrin IX monomethyl ester cyclase
MKLLLIEPPKNYWFVMGDYLPPPFNLILLAAVVEKELPDVEVKVIDSQAEELDWMALEQRIKQEKADIVGTGSHATCNVYKTVRTLDIAKKSDPEVITITGGSHFTMFDEETLNQYPFIDIIVRYEAEKALVDLLRHFQTHGRLKEALKNIKGIAFKQNGDFRRTADYPPLTSEELDSLPYPAYHLLPDMKKYHFAMMSDAPYIILEGSRGCTHNCTFCSQTTFYRRHWSAKSVKRIADEMEWMYNTFGSRFFWFTDDNFCGGSPRSIEDLCQEMLSRGLNGDEIEWFAQMRVDSILKVDTVLSTMNRAGNYWQLVGGESPLKNVLDEFKKGIQGNQTIDAIKLLKKNNIMAQLMIMLGHENETRESIQQTMRWATDVVKPDFIITMLVTPYPGTPMYEDLSEKGRIIDDNWTNYDMIHAVCDMKYLSAIELQEELYNAYRHVYDSWSRRFGGIFSRNKYKRRIFWYYFKAGVVGQLKKLIP